VVLVDKPVELTGTPPRRQVATGIEGSEEAAGRLQLQSRDLAAFGPRHDCLRNAGSIGQVLLPPSATHAQCPHSPPHSRVVHTSKHGEQRSSATYFVRPAYPQGGSSSVSTNQAIGVDDADEATLFT
jgi:hypothetical protein